MQRWAERTFGPDWRALGAQPMEAWAVRMLGPNWRQRLDPRPKPAPRVVTLDAVMADDRQWFLAHVAGDGWTDRTVVMEGFERDPMAAAKRRLTNKKWTLCGDCNVPVYADDRQQHKVNGKSYHAFCTPQSVACQDRDASGSPAAA